MRRQKSTILFATIAMLLTAKAGLTLWEFSVQDFQPGSSAQRSVSTQTASIPAASTLKVSTLSTTMPSRRVRHSKQASVRVQRISPEKSNDSWAMLETYLIPEAGAASAPMGTGPVIEDKTLTSLRQYREKLDQRSKKLDQRSQSLQQAEDALKQRITELEQLEANIQQRLTDESKIKNKKIKRLTAVYEGMKPERAAPVIAKMELATVVKIFLLMDEKKVGKILSFLPPDKAVSISQALTSQISSVK